MAMTQTAGPAHASREPVEALGRLLFAGAGIVVALIFGFGGWAAATNIGGAVIASGTVVVDSNSKKVQHPTGGVVGEIKVKDGDVVREGDLLVRLDETVTRANLAVITKQLDQLAIRQARLRAERDNAVFDIPPSLLRRLDEPEVAEMVHDEGALFQNRKTSREGQKSQLKERVEQLREEVKGLVGQQKAKDKEIQLVKIELAGQTELWDKKLMALTKYTATQREAARLDGELGAIVSRIAQTRGKIVETDMQILQVDQELRTEVSKDLREVQGKESELVERKVAAEDQLKRIDIRAPQTGVVHQLAVHTVGGVISASDVMMVIVPGNDTLVIDARIAPQDIDHVKAARIAHIRFSAFNQRTTPEFDGVVQRVSADTTRDAGQNNIPYFVARITLPEAEMAKLGNLKLVPGMPAEVQIKTGDRTALSYFVKPLQDQWARTFREQ